MLVLITTATCCDGVNPPTFPPSLTRCVNRQEFLSLHIPGVRIQVMSCTLPRMHFITVQCNHYWYKILYSWSMDSIQIGQTLWLFKEVISLNPICLLPVPSIHFHASAAMPLDEIKWWCSASWYAIGHSFWVLGKRCTFQMTGQLLRSAILNIMISMFLHFLHSWHILVSKCPSDTTLCSGRRCDRLSIFSRSK